MDVRSCPFKSLLGNQVGGLSLESKKGTTTLSDKFSQKFHLELLLSYKKETRAIQLKFVGLEEQDIIILKKLKPLIEENVLEIVRSFLC